MLDLLPMPREILERIVQQERVGLIDDPDELNGMLFKLKAVSIHWELMFTRPLFGTPDIAFVFEE